MDALVQHAITIMLRKLDDKSYSAGRVLVAGSMIERESLRTIGETDKRPAE